MKKLENLEVEFIDEVDGTYVVRVNVSNKAFEVNCQTYMTNNYTESRGLSCSNESGGDIYDSGLSKYLESIGVEDSSDEWNEIVAAIEDCAEEQQPENSVVRILREKEFDDTIKHEDSLFGAFGPTDVYHERYVSDDGTIIVASEDTSQNRAENQLLGYKTFSDAEEYEDWRSRIYDDGHYGDCSVSYRAWQDICGTEEY